MQNLLIIFYQKCYRDSLKDKLNHNVLGRQFLYCLLYGSTQFSRIPPLITQGLVEFSRMPMKRQNIYIKIVFAYICFYSFLLQIFVNKLTKFNFFYCFPMGLLVKQYYNRVVLKFKENALIGFVNVKWNILYKKVKTKKTVKCHEKIHVTKCSEIITPTKNNKISFSRCIL